MIVSMYLFLFVRCLSTLLPISLHNVLRACECVIFISVRCCFIFFWPFSLFFFLFCFARITLVLIGILTLSRWCEAMESATHLGLPWRLLREKLAPTQPGFPPLDVHYNLTLELLNTDLIVSITIDRHIDR